MATDTTRGIRMGFAAAYEAACERECVATQDACNRLAADIRGGRSELLSRLRSDTFRGYGGEVDGLHDLLMVAWKSADVLLVTGKTRDAWLTAIDDVQKRAWHDRCKAG